MRGGVRAWPLPARVARVAATTNSKFYAAFLDRAGTTITATSLAPVLTSVSPSTGIRSIGPHEYSNLLLQPSSSGATFATYGYNDVIELWSSATMARTRVINTGQGSVSQLSLTGDTGDLLSSGRDGRIVRWNASGDPAQIARVDQPIDGFVRLRATGSILFSTADGALWRTDPSARGLVGPAARSLVASADQRTVCRRATAAVIAIDTRTWRPTCHQTDSAVRELSITPDVSSSPLPPRRPPRPRTDTDARLRRAGRPAAHARHRALTSDGVLIVLGTGGTIWLYCFSPPLALPLLCRS